jgi:hypothetical protein
MAVSLANDFMFAILQAKVVLLFDITKKKERLHHADALLIKKL